MEITIGRIVLYTLGEQDAAQINRRRTTGADIAARIKKNTDTASAWPLGAQAHIGTQVSCNETYPMIVTRVVSQCIVNGQVLLDGNDCFWAQGVAEGRGPTCWSWPPRV